MSGDGVWRGAQAAAVAAGERQAAAVCGVIAARAAAVPGLAVTVDGDAVVLSGRGLLARAFGSRRAPSDPRLVGLSTDFNHT